MLGPMHVKSRVHPLRVESPPVLWSSCTGGGPPGPQNNTQCSGGSCSWCRTHRLEKLMWGSELSLLWEKLCCIIIFQLRVTFPVEVGFGDGGVWVQWSRHAPVGWGQQSAPALCLPVARAPLGQQGSDWRLLWVAQWWCQRAHSKDSMGSNRPLLPRLPFFVLLHRMVLAIPEILLFQIKFWYHYQAPQKLLLLPSFLEWRLAFKA